MSAATVPSNACVSIEFLTNVMITPTITPAPIICKGKAGVTPLQIFCRVIFLQPRLGTLPWPRDRGSIAVQYSEVS